MRGMKALSRGLLACLLALPLALPPVPVARAADAAPPGRVRLNWIGHWKGEDLRERFVLEMKRDYEFLHPEVSVNLVFDADLPGSEPDHKLRSAQAIVDMITTGRIDWDVVYLDHGVFEHVADRLKDRSWTARHLVDFSQVPGFPASQEPFITADPRYRERTGGILTGPYTESYLMNLWYNTEVAAKTGVRVKERGMTFDDLVACAERLHRYNREHGTAVTFVKLSAFNRTDTLFESLFRSQFDRLRRGRRARLHRGQGAGLPAHARGLRAARPLPAGREPGLAGPHDRGLAAADARRRRRALHHRGDVHVQPLPRRRPGAGREDAARREPRARRHARVLVGDYTPVFAVMKNSPNRDVAVDFLMSWATPKNAERWVRYTKNLTGVRGYLSDATSRQVDAFGDVYEKYLVDMQKRTGARPIVNLRDPTYVFGADTPVTVVELREKLAAILEGRLTARAYYDDVLRRLGPRGR